MKIDINYEYSPKYGSIASNSVSSDKTSSSSTSSFLDIWESSIHSNQPVRVPVHVTNGILDNI